MPRRTSAARLPRAHLVVTALAIACSLIPASAAGAGMPRKGSYGARLGSHSMLYLNSAPAQQRAMFIAARDAGVRYLRMDITTAVTFGQARGMEDYTALRRIDALAAEYKVEVLGVIAGLSWWLTACPPDTPADRMAACPLRAGAEAEWSAMVAATVREAPHVRHWELFNEPDRAWLYAWTPDEYAHIATVTAKAIRAALPAARIVLGGASFLDRSWLAAVLHDADEPVIRIIDIANVHLRGLASRVYSTTRDAKRYFASLGFDGPLWITETGYPSLPAHQWDPAYRDGDASQIAYLRRLVPDMMRGGADAMFLTFRDGPEFGRSSPYASEGLVRWPALVAGRAVYKPAFRAVASLAARRLPAAVARARAPGDAAAVGPHAMS